jgi:hypothetical protein
MNRAKLLVIFAVCFVMWCSWLFRYDLKPSSSSTMPAAYILDRWSGKTYVSFGGRDWQKIKIDQSIDPSAVSWDESAKKPETVGTPTTGHGFIPLDNAPTKVKSWDEIVPVKK